MEIFLIFRKTDRVQLYSLIQLWGRRFHQHITNISLNILINSVWLAAGLKFNSAPWPQGAQRKVAVTDLMVKIFFHDKFINIAGTHTRDAYSSTKYI